MSLLRDTIHWYLKRRIPQIEFFIKNPIETQNQIRKYLLLQAKDTEYGKKYKFSSVISYQDFKNQIPIVNYEDFEPYIEKARKGQSDVFWKGKIRYFAKSSGTTNAKSKFIPISDESLNECHYKAGKDLLSIYINNHPESNILNLKNLRLGGSSQIYEGFGTKYGDLSAILIDNLPFWAEFYNIPDKKVSLMEEWEIKMQEIIKQVVNQNVVSLTGVPSWMLVLLQKIMYDYKIDYLDDLWQNLEVFFHGGINFTPYKNQYDLIVKKQINYYEIYNASEGFFAIQDVYNSNEMLLLLDCGVFYEFIPMINFYDENPKIIDLQDVKTNINYALVITTNGGLWRYIIGDTIMFTSINPYRIKITGRTKHFINAFGEELMIDNAERALKIACQTTNSIIKEYSAGPVFMTEKSKGAHQWIIEFTKKPKDINTFKSILDQELKKLNSDYEAKRYKNITLNEPEIIIAKENLFMEWMALRGKLGGQNKVPRLSNNRDYLDSLFALNNNSKL